MTIKNNKLSGFTLIEIVIAMAIIAVVFSMAIAGTNRMSSRSNLNLIAEALTSNLRSTAMSALNSEQFQLQVPVAWGVQIEANATPSYYTIFADLDGDLSYDQNEKVRTVILDKNIKFLCTNFNGDCYLSGAVAFNLSSALPAFNGTDITTMTGDITIQLEDITNSETRNIVVNIFGLVGPENL